MDNDKHKPLWSFGVITDTHIRSPDGDQSSPYAVNDKANSRAKFACQLLAAQKPAFTIHLGDMVHPLPSMQSYDAACQEAIKIFEPLLPNLHFVSGNHDVGDKPMPGSPAAVVNDAAMDKYSSWFGQHWYSLDVDKVRIIVINSSLINTGLLAEKQQNDWLDDQLANSHDYQVILFSHYPPFIHDSLEPEHYDNIAEPGRAELLNKLQNNAVDMILSGHVHHFFYNKLGKTQLYTLPSTSFTRQDYADLFKLGPADEFGRDDKSKYAVTMVDVYADKLALRVINTDGQQYESTNSIPNFTEVAPPSNKKICVSMRHPWHESIDLPFNGPMEEFTRKRARNDYNLLRLMQLGINHLRIPLQDLIDPAAHQRIEDCIDQGFVFTVVCLQDAWQHVPGAIEHLSSAIKAIEYVLPTQALYWKYPTKIDQLDAPVYLGFAHTGAHTDNQSDTATKPFAHTVCSGFKIDKLDCIASWHKKQANESAADGFVVHIPWEESLSQSMDTLKQWLSHNPYQLFVNLRIAKSNPAEQNIDAQCIADRICSAIELVDSIERLELQLDTFMSLDRGYSPRMGLVDRLGNLTSVGQLIAAQQ